MRLFLFSCLLFGLTACGGETEASEPQTVPDATVPVETIDPADIPRSSGCSYISDEKILEIIAQGVEGTTISSQPGRTVSACYYRIEGKTWSADLVIDVMDGYDASNLLKDVTAASPAEKMKVKGQPAQLMAGSRILRVAAKPPFDVKLSVLPKGEEKNLVGEAERKAMLVALAESLVKDPE
jgi:hypothetical protein